VDFDQEFVSDYSAGTEMTRMCAGDQQGRGGFILSTVVDEATTCDARVSIPSPPDVQRLRDTAYWS
jgi:hypothetical protein